MVVCYGYEHVVLFIVVDVLCGFNACFPTSCYRNKVLSHFMHTFISMLSQFLNDAKEKMLMAACTLNEELTMPFEWLHISQSGMRPNVCFSPSFPGIRFCRVITVETAHLKAKHFIISSFQTKIHSVFFTVIKQVWIFFFITETDMILSQRCMQS